MDEATTAPRGDIFFKMFLCIASKSYWEEILMLRMGDRSRLIKPAMIMNTITTGTILDETRSKRTKD